MSAQKRITTEISMKIKLGLLFAIASAILLAACAGQPETYTPTTAAPVTVPKGTVTGGASVGDSNALAQLVVEGNNNASDAQASGS
jgi:uncharacterized lipoprotein YajG